MADAGILCVAKSVGSFMYHRESARGMPAQTALATIPALCLFRCHAPLDGSASGDRKSERKGEDGRRSRTDCKPRANNL